MLTLVLLLGALGGCTALAPREVREASPTPTADLDHEDPNVTPPPLLPRPSAGAGVEPTLAPLPSAAPLPILTPDALSLLLREGEVPNGFVVSRSVSAGGLTPYSWVRWDTVFLREEPTTSTLVSGAFVASDAAGARDYFEHHTFEIASRYTLDVLRDLFPPAPTASPRPSGAPSSSPSLRPTPTASPSPTPRPTSSSSGGSGSPRASASASPAPLISFELGEANATYQVVTASGLRGYLALWVQGNVVMSVLVIGDQDVLGVDTKAVGLLHDLALNADKHLNGVLGSPVRRTSTPAPSPSRNPSATGSLAPSFSPTPTPAPARTP